MGFRGVIESVRCGGSWCGCNWTCEQPAASVKVFGSLGAALEKKQDSEILVTEPEWANKSFGRAARSCGRCSNSMGLLS